MLRLLNGETVKHPSFAPPFLKAGDLVIAQTANILHYLGPRHGLAPADEAGRLWTNQLQLTFTDFVKEIHDTHHPIASALYYEEQREEAKRYTVEFLKVRAPKYLGYFERVLERNGGKQLAGNALTYADLSLFQVVDRPALRLPEGDGAAGAESSAHRLGARQRRRAPAHRGVSCLAPPPRAQPARHIPALSRAGRVEKIGQSGRLS